MKKLCILSIFLFLLGFFPKAPFLYANNLSLSNTRIISLDSTTNTAVIEFDISWENSWRDSTNYDAVWVFIKGNFTKDSANSWNHVYLKTSGTNPSGFSAGSGTALELVVPEDKAGLFIQRSAQGSGSVSTTDIQVVWDLTVNDFNSDIDSVLGGTGVFDLRIYGIEMTYIPQGGFHAGDGNTGSAGQFEYGSSSSLPPAINSEEGISFTSSAYDAWYYNSVSQALEWTSGTLFNISSSFPKGYNAFYLMKYEMSAGQYVAFLNSLTRDQQQQRVASPILGSTIPNFFVMANSTATNSRNRVTCASTQADTSTRINFSATSSIGAGRENRAMNFLKWADLAAYADWAALRPMTEFEFEKAARGPIYPVRGEYVWGTTSYTSGRNISGTEDGTEIMTTANMNCVMGNFQVYIGGDASTGPLRCGIFATSSTSTRAQSGAGYYGNLEMTGNVMEMVVTVGNSAGLSFAGTHGDGALTDTTPGTTYAGNATNLDWPGIDNDSADRGVVYGTGSGRKGYSYTLVSTGDEGQTSERRQASWTVFARNAGQGGRVARTAPSS